MLGATVLRRASLLQVREREADLDNLIMPIEDMYSLLARCRPCFVELHQACRQLPVVPSTNLAASLRHGFVAEQHGRRALSLGS